MFVIIQLLEELDLTPADPRKSDGEAYPGKNRYTYNLPCKSQSETNAMYHVAQIVHWHVADDLNRVRLRVLKNDYINASWVNVS